MLVVGAAQSRSNGGGGSWSPSSGQNSFTRWFSILGAHWDPWGALEMWRSHCPETVMPGHWEVQKSPQVILTFTPRWVSGTGLPTLLNPILLLPLADVKSPQKRQVYDVLETQMGPSPSSAT